MAATTTGMASFLANMRAPEGVNPVNVTLPDPPRLEGALAPNSWLSKAVRFADNMVEGPESMVVVNGYVYTGLSNGWVVEVPPAGRGNVRKIRRMSMPNCGTQNAPEDACGRPLGIRKDPNGYLIVADAYNGIFRLNPVTGVYEQLVYARNQQVNGKKLGFINDVAVARDGTIFFTSSSTKWTRKQYLDIILEGETSGRVLVYNPRLAPRDRVQELVTNLNFPNGLELTENEDALLIAEGARARIFKAYIGSNSPKRETIEVFAENLPGFVDNIRRSPRGTYWVGLSTVRHEGEPSVLDKYGDNPEMRGVIMGMPRDQVMAQAPNYGIAVELDANGNIIRSIQDPDGLLYTAVSEIQEEKDTLYIGSFDKPFIGLLKLSDLPAPIPKDPVVPPEEANNQQLQQQLQAFISDIRQRLRPMPKQVVDNIVLALVEALVKAKLEALRNLQRVRELNQRLQDLQNQVGTTASPMDPAGTGTTMSASDTTAASGSAGGTTADGAASGTTASGTTANDGGSTAAPSSDASTQASGDTSTQASGSTQAGTTAASADTTSAAADGTTAAGTTAAGTTLP